MARPETDAHTLACPAELARSPKSYARRQTPMHGLAILPTEVGVFGPMLTDTGTWLPIIVIGAILFVGGTAYASFAKKSWDWSVADAVITRIGKLNLDTHHNTVSNRWDTPLNIHVEYSYMADGEQWKNEHIARWRSTGRKELREAEEFRQNNPVGKRFQLLYNPNNPFDSLLNGPRNPAVGSVISTFGLASVAFGLLNWFFEPSLAAQVALVATGLVACAGAYAFVDYPFERPWWFEKSEEETERFMREAVSVQQPDRTYRFRKWGG